MRKVIALAALAVVSASSHHGEKKEMLKKLLSGEVTLAQVQKHAATLMSKEAAYKMVDLTDIVPAEHLSLLQANVTESAADTAADAAAADPAAAPKKLEDTAVKKAIKVLNGMLESTEEEIDGLLVECKQFHARNRALAGALDNDVVRMTAEIQQLEKQGSAAMMGIEEEKVTMETINTKMKDEMGAYGAKRAEDDALMTTLKNDLAVAEFIMEVTECPRAKASEKKGKKLLIQKDSNGLFRFEDPKIQERLEMIEHNDTKGLLQNALSAAFAGKRAAGRGMKDRMDVPVLADGEYAETGTMSYSFLQIQTELETEVECAHMFLQTQSQTGTASAQPAANNPKPRNTNKCTRGRVDMCLLNDNMSLMWGEQKDSVDELTDDMKKEENMHEELISDLKRQGAMSTESTEKADKEMQDAMMKRGLTIASKEEKEAELEEADKDFKQTYEVHCMGSINNLVYQKSCGLRTVRNDVADRGSKAVGSDKITDCELSDFVFGDCMDPENGDAAYPCDPTKDDDAVAVGGLGVLQREILTPPNTLGQACGKLSFPARCNAHKCPIDCKMSSFSGWSKCTADCEGGTKSRTADVVVKPKFGGDGCGPAVNTVPCNTESCDKDCTLHEWTEYSMCSQACDGGYKDKVRKIHTPSVGGGAKCVKKYSPMRYKKAACNTQKCMGDEQCIAKVDLIIAIDASGSTEEHGFEQFKNFTMEIQERFKAVKYKRKAMKVGIIQFGNGRIIKQNDTSLVAPAIKIQPLTFDLVKLAKSTKGMKHSGGFTNMAQAFVLAKEMFLNGGRKRAQSQLLVITDGKPSFVYNTEKEANALRDSGVHINMFVVHPHEKSKDVELMKSWATHPWQAHFFWAEGLKGLQQTWKDIKTAMLVQFCPRAQSPKLMELVAVKKGFELVREKRDCLAWWWRIHPKCSGGRCYNKGDCAAAALKMGVKYYVVYESRWSKRAYCYGHKDNDGKCQFPKMPWMRSKGWTNSVYSVYGICSSSGGKKTCATGANSAKTAMLTQTDKEGVRPEDDKAGSHDEEADGARLQNRDLDQFPEDDVLPDDVMADNVDDDEI